MTMKERLKIHKKIEASNKRKMKKWLAQQKKIA